MEDTVDVDLEGDLELGNATGGWWDAGQVELAEEMVALGYGCSPS